MLYKMLWVESCFPLDAVPSSIPVSLKSEGFHPVIAFPSDLGSAYGTRSQLLWDGCWGWGWGSGTPAQGQA